MSTTTPRAPQQPDFSPPSNQPTTYFTHQRTLLVNEIAAALDTTLTHLNRLNRSLESIVAVGNEFSSVEALWSHVEGVMGDRDAASSSKKEGEERNGDAEEQEEEETELSMEEPHRR